MNNVEIDCIIKCSVLVGLDFRYILVLKFFILVVFSFSSSGLVFWFWIRWGFVFIFVFVFFVELFVVFCLVRFEYRSSFMYFGFVSR